MSCCVHTQITQTIYCSYFFSWLILFFLILFEGVTLNGNSINKSFGKRYPILTTQISKHTLSVTVTSCLLFLIFVCQKLLYWFGMFYIVKLVVFHHKITGKRSSWKTPVVVVLPCCAIVWSCYCWFLFWCCIMYRFYSSRSHIVPFFSSCAPSSYAMYHNGTCTLNK